MKSQRLLVPVEGAYSQAFPQKDDKDVEPTLISPLKKEDGVAGTAYFWYHIVVWLAAVVVTGFSNIGVFLLQNRDVSCQSGSEICYHDDPTFLARTCGVVGTVCVIMTLVILFVFHTCLYSSQYKQAEWMLVLFCFNFVSLVSTSWVFISAARKSNTFAYHLGTIAVVVHVLSTSVLYSSAGALPMKNLGLCTAAPLAFSVSLLLAFGVLIDDISLGHEWDTGKPIPFSMGQKFACWIVFFLVLAGMIVLVIFGCWKNARSGRLEHIKNYPFVRSLLLFVFSLATCCSLYTHSFVSKDIDMASGTLSLASFATVFLVTASVAGQ